MNPLGTIPTILQKKTKNNYPYVSSSFAPLVVSVFLSIGITLIPLGYLVVFSLAGPWRFPNLYPEVWNFRALAFLQTNSLGILLSLGSSFLYSMGAVFLALLWTWLPAKYFAYQQFQLKALAESLLLAPAILPAITFAPGTYRILLALGLADTRFGVMLILSLVGSPYLFRSLKIGFLRYPREVSSTAFNLGGTKLQVFFKIELPALMPSILSGATLVFLTGFSEYFLVFLVGGGIVPSFPGYLIPFIAGGDQGISASLISVFLVLPLVLLALQELYLKGYYRKRSNSNEKS